MKWLARYAARVAVRRVVLLLVLGVLAWAGVGRAYALDNSYACVGSPNGGTCADRASAYAACTARPPNFGSDKPQMACLQYQGRAEYRWFITFTSGSTSWRSEAWKWVSECPTGTNWDDNTKSCTTDCGTDGWPDPLNPGQCLNDSKCRERNETHPLGEGLQTRGYTSKCLAGCEYGVKPGYGYTTTFTDGFQTVSGEFAWNGGGQCGLPDAPSDPPSEEPKDEREQCSAVPGSDMTRCVRNDGSVCLSATGGAQICWSPGETGTKGHQNIAQVANAGDTPIPPPNMNLPNGDALEPKGPPVNVETVNHSTNTTIHKTIQNYQTINGTDAGGKDGVPAPGTPNHKPPGPDGPDDGKGEDGSASGGEDCDNAPIVSDPMLGMIATQAWATRCAVKAGNSAKVTGDVGDCKSEFAVEGDHAAAQQLRAMRAAICGAEAREETAKAEREDDTRTLDQDSDALTQEFGENVFADGDGDGVQFNTGWWTAGGGACPDLSATLPSWAGGATWTPPPRFCDSLRWLSLLFQSIAMVWGIRIIMGK